MKTFVIPFKIFKTCDFKFQGFLTVCTHLFLVASVSETHFRALIMVVDMTMFGVRYIFHVWMTWGWVNDDSLIFYLNFSYKRSCLKNERLLLRVLLCFFVQPRASSCLLLKRAASVFEAFEGINPKFQCRKICISDHMKTNSDEVQVLTETCYGSAEVFE